jgi:hypothetical protein
MTLASLCLLEYLDIEDNAGALIAMGILRAREAR